MKLKTIIHDDRSLNFAYVDRRYFKRYIADLYESCIGSSKKYITCKQMKKEIKFIFIQSVTNCNVMLLYIKEVS